MKFKVSAYCLFFDINHKHCLAYSTRKGMGVKISYFVYDLIQEERFSELPDNLYNILMYHEIIIPADENELEEVITKNHLRSQEAEEDTLYTFVHSYYEGRAIYPDSEKLVLISSPDNDELEKAISIFTGFSGNYRHLLVIGTDHTGLTSEYLNRLHLEKLSLHHVIDNPASLEACVESCRALESWLNETTDQTEVEHFFKLNRQLDQNSIDQLIDLLHSIKIASIRFDLSGLMENEEKEFLNRLANHKVFPNLLPFPVYTTVAQSQNYTSSVFGAVSLGKMKFWVRERYNDFLVRKLAKNEIKCSQCQYLPLCGGKEDKDPHSDRDCPSFLSNIEHKVKLKYHIHPAV